MNDPISDLLTRLRNAGQAFLPEVKMPHSNLKEGIARLLKQEGYLSEVHVEGAPFKMLKLKLKYVGRKPVLEGSRRVSSPGLRRYVGATAVPRVRGGMGTSILSTPEGIMTGTQARKKNVGGELLCEVW
ncbi:MAG: 30S ribosomal protein S8 [Verrucomicrobiota bacterium]|jgi:small subunit ribosomal protein S8|nr:30S ribosomal protein S8 [Candidatus Acidoferrum sp.]